MKQKKLLSVLLAGAMVVSRSSIFYRMERTAGGISGEPRGGKIDLLQL